MLEKEANDNIDINSYIEVMEKEYNSITNARDLYTRLRAELFISNKNREDKIIGFITYIMLNARGIRKKNWLISVWSEASMV